MRSVADYQEEPRLTYADLNDESGAGLQKLNRIQSGHLPSRTISRTYRNSMREQCSKPVDERWEAYPPDEFQAMGIE
jgi:hypothetical protein